MSKRSREGLCIIGGIFTEGFLEDYLNSDLDLGISRNSRGLIAKLSALFFFTGSKQRQGHSGGFGRWRRR
jgi:hypothetical protein